MKELIKRLLRENLESSNIIRLYHSIANKKNLEVGELIKNVFNNGLIPNDNGEVGPVIWFSPNYNDYAMNGKFVVAYDYDKSKSYEENNGIKYNDWSAPFGFEPIPFNNLKLIKVPIMSVRDRYFTNEDVIRLINESKMTPEKFNGISGSVVIMGDLFNKFVQPEINYPNFLNEIDQSKIKVINVL